MAMRTTAIVPVYLASFIAEMVCFAHSWYALGFLALMPMLYFDFKFVKGNPWTKKR